MRELQQVTTTVPDAAKRCRFYRVELLNGGKYRTRGEVPPDRRKRGKDGRSGKGGKVEEQERKRVILGYLRRVVFPFSWVKLSFSFLFLPFCL